MSILQSSKLIPLHSTIDIIIQFELTFVHLRYSLGGDRPSQTTNHTLFILKILVIYFNKSGISLLSPQFTGVKVSKISTYSIHIK
jgi:hypothetical protein